MKSLVIAVLVALAALVWWATSASKSTTHTSAPLEIVGHEDAASATSAQLGSVREVADVSSEPLRKEASSVVRGAGIHLFGSISREDGGELTPNGIDVHLLDERALDRPTRVRTDLSYSYTGLRAGRMWLCVDEDRCAAQKIAIDLDDDHAEYRLDVVLTARTRIAVRLVAEDGAKITRLSTIPIFEEMVHVRELEFIASTTQLPASMMRPPGKQLEVRTSAVYARRVDSHEPEPPVDLLRTEYPRADHWENLRESDQVPEACVAVLECNRPAPLWVSIVWGMNVIMSQLVSPTDREVVFTIPARGLGVQYSRVRLMVVDDATREPIAKVQVNFMRRRVRATEEPLYLNREADGTEAEPLSSTENTMTFSTWNTNSTGNIEFDGVATGWNEIRLDAAGYESLSMPIEIAQARTQDLGTIALRPLAEIRGRMVDDNDQGIIATVWAIRFSSIDASRRLPAVIGTAGNASGVFALTSVGRGQSIVFVRCANWMSRPRVIDTTAGPVSDVVLRCSKPAKVTLFVSNEVGADATVRVETNDGLPVFDEFKGARERIDVPLAQGKYVVRIRRGKERILDRAFEVRGDGLTVDLTR